ncbi:sodium-dependent glucose transporter 1A-like [Mizuhopecten yessoensis]|uniref:Sodium-dependent glucose transporter 1A n=1 Tax=Mizuhopecten yessoensis TaxID=6573 RepID=A0A210PF97_MIZYE|nr:sodium-dependent glucose transporter 1A-like [Mizuhopecten yessoensis]OWF35131.1 Sodium-dependent glucose transporter 1A [Mizuhopecten yessoensis]
MSSILTDSNLSLAFHSNHDISRKQAVADPPDVPTGMWSRIQHDPIYRQKFINTLCLYASFLGMSFAKGQIGPSFLDLQAISGVGLKGGSGMLTTMYIGYMAGAILGGILYDKFKRSLLLAFAKFILACALVAIPWCSMYWLMVMAFFFLGATVGATDAICNAEIQFIWGKDGRRFMQCLHFMYSFGVALTPLITIAFLEEAPDSVTSEGQSIFPHLHNNTVLNSTTILNISGEVFISHQSNTSQNGSSMPNKDTEYERSPELYKAYIITSCVIMTVFVMQLSFFFRYDRKKTTITKKETESVTTTKSRLPLSIKIQAILNMAGILALICGIDDTLVSFLATFCVKEFGWTKTEGSLLTSLTCFIVVIGRFLAIFLVGVMSPVTLVGLHSVMTALVFMGTYICVLFKSNIGLWIVMPIFGYAKAPIFACIFTWTDEVFVPVTGRVSSMFFIVITASMALNPLILGFLMENFSNVWFCYLFFGESVLLVLLFFTALLLTRRVKRLYGTNHDTMAIEVKVAETLLEKRPDITSQ